jgi:hypothetical protein
MRFAEICLGRLGTAAPMQLCVQPGVEMISIDLVAVGSDYSIFKMHREWPKNIPHIRKETQQVRRLISK